MSALIKIIVFVIAVITMVHSQRVVDAPSNMPPNLPWIPQWVECDFDFETFKNGPACNDCYSTLRCTPNGGILRNCFGKTPYCVEGKCGSEPSEQCAEVETITDMYLNSDE